MSGAILPDATIGILGGGQLGRMLAFVAKRMGYRVAIYSDVADSPAAQVSDFAFVGDYADGTLLKKFSEACDVVTYEFENIPIETCRFLEEHLPLRPHSDAIYYAQHRAREREMLTSLQIPVARYHHLLQESDISSVPEDFPYPAILKTASFGYDGKGQMVVPSADQLLSCWQSLSKHECILEETISFEKEFSIIIARDCSGATESYGPIENHHERHILDISLCPGGVPESSGGKAVAFAKQIAEKLSVCGVITVEFFLKANGDVLVNEVAPRPHNSGHLTIEGFRTSQFEQQLRGVCGLSLGSSEQLSPAVMVNLLGDLWGDSQALATEPVFREPSAFLHLYGKQQARAGRKMGHLTVLSPQLDQAKEKALSLRQKISVTTSTLKT